MISRPIDIFIVLSASMSSLSTPKHWCDKRTSLKHVSIPNLHKYSCLLVFELLCGRMGIAEKEDELLDYMLNLQEFGNASLVCKFIGLSGAKMFSLAF